MLFLEEYSPILFLLNLNIYIIIKIITKTVIIDKYTLIDYQKN